MIHEKSKIAVIGLGYVGFPLACAIAKNPLYEVVGYNRSVNKVDLIKKRISPVEDDFAEEAIKTVNMEVSTDANILDGSSIYIIAVPTPIDSEYNPDLGPVKDAVRLVCKYLEKGQSVIIESTINPGVCEEEVLPIIEQETGMKGGVDFELAHCPERINPGDPVWNVTNINRNIGALTKEGAQNLAYFYKSFLDAEVNVMDTIKEAEATKIVENTFRDINIAYVNELAKSFDAMGINLPNVIRGASNKPFAFIPHFPGCGVGGHCISVDPYYLIERAKKAGFDHKFLKMARDTNNSMPEYTVDKLILGLNELKLSAKGSKIGVLGLSFKANIGDMRESPALQIIKILETKYGVDVQTYDPYLPDMSTHDSLEDILEECDAVVLATNHKEFVEADIDSWKKIKLVIDGRNCLDKEKLKSEGIAYDGIGQN